MAEYPKTQWHHLLGRLLELLLTPVGIEVLTDPQVLGTPPRADVLLLRREGATWTEAQRARLADGLRDTDAGHVLLEFKRSEGLSEAAWRQILAYDYFYGQSRSLGRSDLASFLIGASTPNPDLLRALGYRAKAPGVYYSEQRLLRPVGVILLNELCALEHNIPLKCFATRRREQSNALTVLRRSGLLAESLELERLIHGLWRLVMKEEPEIDALTPEYVEQVGQEFLDALLKAAPADMVLRHYSPEQRLAGLDPQQRLAGLDPEQRLAGLDPEQRLAGLDPEDIRRYLERLEQQGKKH